ncbi:hypothetical protein D4S03_02290 [bacterium]|nr:MAG: hypothetical protein D4S03_02290 [bacterium]
MDRARFGLGELPALRGYQARLEDASSGLEAVSDDQPVLYMGHESEAVLTDLRLVLENRQLPNPLSTGAQSVPAPQEIAQNENPV